jgi:cation transport ATPase
MSVTPAKPFNSLRTTTISWADGVIQLRTPDILRKSGETGDDLRVRLIDRLLNVDGVCSLSVDCPGGLIEIRHTAGSGASGASMLLERLARAIRAPAELSERTRLATTDWLRRSRFTVYRHGAVLSTWQVVHHGPGRLRIRHDSLRSDPKAIQRVARRLSSASGVRRAEANPWTGSLLIGYDPAAVSAPRLIRLAEDEERTSGTVPGPGQEPSVLQPTPTDQVAVSTSEGPPPLPSQRTADATLGLAAMGDLALPWLSPVSALLLVGGNLGTFRTAWHDLRQRRLTLPVLGTTIVGATLASGQFLGAALMSWFAVHWKRRLHQDLSTEQQRLVGDCVPTAAWSRQLVADGSLVRIETDRLVPGDRFRVETSEVIPADGFVLEGEAVVDERSLRGLDGASRKRPGDTALAGSMVLAGSLTVEARRVGHATRASAFGRAMAAAIRQPPGTSTPTVQAEQFATRTVAPALTVSGVNLLLMGDPGAATAVLRPDYATGPSAAVSLETLRDVVACARLGIAVRAPDALARIDQSDVLVLDDLPALRRCAVELDHLDTPLPDETRPDLLRYAACAARLLDDDRASALAAACNRFGIHRLDLPPADFCEGVSVVHGSRRIRIREIEAPGKGLSVGQSLHRIDRDRNRLRDPERERDHGFGGASCGSLQLEINDRIVASLTFRRSSRPVAADTIRRLAARRPDLPIVLMSGRSQSEAAALGASLRVNRVCGNVDALQKAAFLRDCRRRGLRPAFVGDGARWPGIAAEAFSVISLPGEGREGAAGTTSPVFNLDLDEPGLAFPEPGLAHVQLLNDRIDRLDALWAIARDHTERVGRGFSVVVVPNLACVVGAFLFGFSGIHSALLSNLGTFGSYRRAVGSLRTLDRPDRLREIRR